MRAYKEIMESGKVWDIKIIGGIMYGFVKLPDCGTCSVVFGNNEDGYELGGIKPLSFALLDSCSTKGSQERRRVPKNDIKTQPIP